MPNLDQLEVVSADGVIEFYDLDPSRGVVNVGSHPENDIVLGGPNVAPFHLVVDHRRVPYQVFVLAENVTTTLDGARLAPHQSTPLQNWGSVEIGDHTLILMSSGGAAFDAQGARDRGVVQQDAAAHEPAAAARGRPDRTPPEDTRDAPRMQPGFAAPPPVGAAQPPAVVHSGSTEAHPEGAHAPNGDAGQQYMSTAAYNGQNGQQGQSPYGLPAPVRDHVDDFILAEIPEREQIVDVEQTAAFQLTVTNASELVASFNVEVEGVDPEWIVILPAQLNMMEEESGMVTITITPPRAPTSVAGRHNVSVTVTTPEYPDRYTELGVTVVINPYYDVQIGELAHKKQTVTWNRPTAETQFQVANSGNSPTQVQLEGQDDERNLHFEFQLAQSDMIFARQAELRLEPGEVSDVGIFVEPNSRRLISMRNKLHQFDIRATPLGGQQFPRTIAGQIRDVPLIGKGLIFLFLSLVALLLILIFRPRIDTFEVSPSSVAYNLANPTPVVLSWRASAFANVRVSGGNLTNVTPEPIGRAMDSPIQSTSYELEADNFLGRLLPFLAVDPVTRLVEVTPVPPEVSLSVDKTSMVMGSPLNINWSIQNADQAILYINDNPQAIPTAEFQAGQRQISPESNVSVRIEASNPSSRAQVVGGAMEEAAFIPQSAQVAVSPPTPTPFPAPQILLFDASPRMIMEGEPVNLQWRVSNVDAVSLSGAGPNAVLDLGTNLPPESSREVRPGPPSMTYLLTGQNQGGERVSQEITIDVTPAPTATPLPEAPQIEFFEISPNEDYVRGSEEPVKLSWSIEGNTTGIELFSPDLQLSANLSKTGELPVYPSTSTFFILTARNGEELATTAQKEVTVVEPTPTPTETPPPTATPTPEPTATPVPLPNIVFFGVSSVNEVDVGKISQTGASEYQVQVGTLLQLSWSVSGGTSVQLRGVRSDGSETDFGSRPPEGTYNLQYDGTITRFQLVAVNSPEEAEAPTQAGTSIEITPVQNVPDAPTNLNGAVQNGQNVLTWSYSSQERPLIQGFRIYRAEVESMNFVPVGETDANAVSWTDPDTPGCSRAYYVAATYVDYRGQTLETDPSSTSWFSPPC